MKYKSVVVTGRGGPEMLQVVENELRPPRPGEARIKIQAAPVCQDDVADRRGTRPFPARIPFTPGYASLGVVDAVGDGVARVSVGDRAAALTRFGGYAEYLYWDAEQLVHAPDGLDPARAVVLILNYLVPMQVMHRMVRVKPGDKALIVGASGGVGAAFMELGKLAGLKMYGLASKSKHYILESYGVTPIDYRSQDFVRVIRAAEPDGIDTVFNGMGEEYFERGLRVLRRGGVLAHYGGPASFTRFLLLVFKMGLYNLLPNGKKIEAFGTHTGDISRFEDDWNYLFQLLAEGKIDPIIQQKFPLLEAARANELLESGRVVGNLVLLSPELL
ncbi:MAG: zinc-binding dehydrogenase [Anaerolineales bacterium]|nr:zinc-binding dehydrogenase [Anaerolineales bacterium]